MDHLIGDLVIVTLKTPRKTKLRGHFKDAINGQLFLTNVLDLKSNKTYLQRSFNADEIVDLFIPAKSMPSSVATTPAREVQRPIDHPHITQNQGHDSSHLSDRSNHLTIHNSRPPIASSVARSQISPGDHLHTEVNSHTESLPERPESQSIPPLQHGNSVDALLPSGSSHEMTGDDDSIGDLHEEYERASRQKPDHSMESQPTLVDVQVTQVDKVQLLGKRRSRPNRSRAVRANHRPTHESKQHQSEGWATEDAGEIHELGDFDFESNLSKFDKRKVWKELEAEDTAVTDDRLVHHNRLPTFDMPTDQLESQINTNHFHKTSSNKLSSLHLASKERADLTCSPTEVVDQYEEMIPPSIRSEIIPLSHKADIRDYNDRSIEAAGSHSENALNGRQILRNAPATSEMMKRPVVVRLQSAKANFSECPVVSAAQLLELEHLVKSEVGLTDELLVENAGQGIARAALQAIENSGVSNPTSFLIVMLLNHTRNSTRVIAAGRHMINHGLMVIAAMSEAEDGTQLTRAMKQQLDLFRRSGGHVLGPEELNALTGRFDRSPGLIIDALTSLHLNFDDLSPTTRYTIAELAGWAIVNAHVDVMAVDCPLGIPDDNGRSLPLLRHRT